MGSKPSNDAPTGLASAPTKKLPPGTWSVNLSDDETRDMTTAELIAGWKKGTVTSDAYVWKEGFADWTPVLEVPELRSKLGPAPRPRMASSSGLARPSQSKMMDMFGGPELSEDSRAPKKPGATPPTQEAEKATGERNESSVLFSLDALKAGIETPPEQPAGPVGADVFGLGGGGGGLGSLGGGLGGLGGLGTGAPLGANTTDLLTAPVQEPP